MKQPAIVVDIDGTLATIGNRGVYEFDKCELDACNDLLREMANFWRAFHANRTVIILSGRQERWRKETLAWLFRNKVKCDILFMRGTNDSRSSEEVKRDIYQEYIAEFYDVLGVFEDHMGNAKMFKRLGLTVYYVGDFDAEAREAPTMEQEKLV